LAPPDENAIPIVENTIDNQSNSVKTNIGTTNDATMSNEERPSSPMLDSTMLDPPDRRMGLAFLCNPTDEHCNVRGHHMSELFSEDVDAVQKIASVQGCKCE
jgi:hypothetical protein